MLEECLYASRDEASDAAAARIGDALVSDTDDGQSAAIVVSGGSTPGPAFQRLSRRELDWNRVTVTLSDERWVPADNPDSNEKMLRETLLQNAAAGANVLSLYNGNSDVGDAAIELADAFGQLPLPFSSVLLGMGEDGHFASLFPDFEGLSAAVDTENDAKFVAVQTVASPHPRISMTLSALLQSREIILLFFGESKRRVYEEAKQGNTSYPVEHLLAQSHVPVRVIWAP